MKILFLAANPPSTAPLALDREIRALQQEVDAVADHAIELVSRWAVHLDDLTQAITRERPDIVHFSGHSTEEGIILDSNMDDDFTVVPPETIEAHFRPFGDTVRVVVINSASSKVIARRISQVLDCAIGIQDVVEAAALTFLRDTAPADVPLDEHRAGRWILERCGTWPFYLQVMGHAIVEEVRAGRTSLLSSDDEYGELYVEHLLEPYNNAFLGRWRELPRPARAALLGAGDGLPDIDELTPEQREAVRRADLYERLRGWKLVADPPFLDWIRRMRTELADDPSTE